MLLDALLACGDSLPLLRLTLLCCPPSSWARLRQSRSSFRAELRPETLAELARAMRSDCASWPLVGPGVCKRRFRSREPCAPGAALHAILDDIDDAAEADDAYDERGESPASASESDEAPLSSLSSPSKEAEACELACVALLIGGSVAADAARAPANITPLMRCAEGGRLRLCRLLLAFRADSDRASVGGATALSLALGSSCGRCSMAAIASGCRHRGCSCQRPAVAALLLQATRAHLPEAFATAVRRALQDERFLPVVGAFVTEGYLPVDQEIRGPDCRLGTALSAALESRVRPIEAPLSHRPAVVAALLELRADPTRRGRYVPWWGGASSPDVLAFAIANGCDAATLELLSAARQQRVV